MSIDDADQRAEQTDAFRVWLRERLRQFKSVHAVEVDAGIRGNALGKFIRGERGARHGLTPLTIQRLAPVLGVPEDVLLAKAGHLSHAPATYSVETAIQNDATLSYEDKLVLLAVYETFTARRRLARERDDDLGSLFMKRITTRDAAPRPRDLVGRESAG